MRRLIPLSTLLACGPLAPPADLPTTTDDLPNSSSSGPTTLLPGSTTAELTAATTATPTTSTLTSSGTTLAQDFIITPDIGDNGPIQCDIWAQDCPPGQKCAAWADGGGGAWNSTRCVEITGDAAPGEPCSSTGGGLSGKDDCAFGAMCWDIDQNNHGTCIALCTGTESSPLCPPSSRCGISSDGVLNLCYPTCEPLLQDCPGDDLCIPNPDGTSFTCVLDASGDEGQTNDPCELDNACDKGLICLDTTLASIACDPGSTGCCTPFCTFPDSPCPNPDQQCVQFFDPMTVPPGYESVGVCAILT